MDGDGSYIDGGDTIHGGSKQCSIWDAQIKLPPPGAPWDVGRLAPVPALEGLLVGQDAAAA